MRAASVWRRICAAGTFRAAAAAGSSAAPPASALGAVGTDETWMYTPSISTAGYSSVEVLMHAHFRQNELNSAAEDIQYSVSNGAWVTFASVEAHPWAEYNFALPSAAVNQANIRIRFITNAKGKKERAEFDNFCLGGN